MKIVLKRAWDEVEDSDGYRVLVDRLWPRGLSHEKLELDDWAKDIAPSDELRKWFDHDAKRWGEFRRRYLAELKEHQEPLRELRSRAEKHKLTLVYGAKDEEHNQAVVIEQYLNMLG